MCSLGGTVPLVQTIGNAWGALSFLRIYSVGGT